MKFQSVVIFYYYSDIEFYHVSQIPYVTVALIWSTFCMVSPILKGNGICMSDMNVNIKGDLASKVYMRWSQVVVIFKFYNHLIQKRLVVHGHLYFNLLFCDRNWKN